MTALGQGQPVQVINDDNCWLTIGQIAAMLILGQSSRQIHDDILSMAMRWHQTSAVERAAALLHATGRD
jgi:hypothetical protein